MLSADGRVELGALYRARIEQRPALGVSELRDCSGAVMGSNDAAGGGREPGRHTRSVGGSSRHERPDPLRRTLRSAALRDRALRTGSAISRVGRAGLVDDRGDRRSQPFLTADEPGHVLVVPIGVGDVAAGVV